MDTTKKVTKITYNGINLPLDGSLEYLMRNSTPEGSKAILTQDGDGTLHAEIPQGVTIIGEEAFRNMQLKSVTIPNGVTEIREASFQGSRLRSVTIPTSVMEIREYAFQNSQLITVVWETSTEIPIDLFYDNKITILKITSDNFVHLLDRFGGIENITPMTVYVQPQLIEGYKNMPRWSELYHTNKCDFVDIALAPTE